MVGATGSVDDAGGVGGMIEPFGRHTVFKNFHFQLRTQVRAIQYTGSDID